MTVFDAFIISIIGLSVGFAVLRGGLKEVATLAALAIGAAAGWFLGTPLASLIGQNGSIIIVLVLSCVLAGAGFLASYIAMASALNHLKLDAQQSLINRVGGGIFGLTRALALIGLGFLAYSFYLDEDQRADAVNDSLLLPVAKVSAQIIEGFAPDRAEPTTATTIESSAAPDGRETTTSADALVIRDNRAMDDLVATVTTSDTPDDNSENSDEVAPDPIIAILSPGSE